MFGLFGNKDEPIPSERETSEIRQVEKNEGLLLMRLTFNYEPKVGFGKMSYWFETDIPKTHEDKINYILIPTPLELLLADFFSEQTSADKMTQEIQPEITERKLNSYTFYKNKDGLGFYECTFLKYAENEPCMVAITHEPRDSVKSLSLYDRILATEKVYCSTKLIDTMKKIDILRKI